MAVENARRKARAAAAPGRLTLGVDTLVTLDGSLYGKPADEPAARSTLERLSAATHEVVSGLVLIDDSGERAAAATTAVSFRALSPALIDWYLRTGEWRDRAGGYAIQGHGAALVAGIEGDYHNVVGLPVSLLLDLCPQLLALDG